MVKLPSMSVIEPGLPSTNTVTPISGSPFASFTVPVTVFWANAVRQIIGKTEAVKALLICKCINIGFDY